MTDQNRPPDRKQAGRIAERIRAGLEQGGGLPGPVHPGRRLTRSEIDDLVSRTIDEALERLNENEND